MCDYKTEIILILSGIISYAQVIPDQKINFDWQFQLVESNELKVNELSNTQWSNVDIPHDWGIEGSYSQENQADWQTGFLPTGIGWYQKTLSYADEWDNKDVILHFEGVYVNADVFINGKYVGHEHHGYLGFEFDITSFLKKGENIINVKVDHSKYKTGRWYTGSGIYRSVWLKVKNPTHIETDGMQFQSNAVNDIKTAFSVNASVYNHSKKKFSGSLEIQILDAEGNLIQQNTKNLQFEKNSRSQTLIQDQVEGINKWSPEFPYLYTLKTALKDTKGVLIDQNIQNIGFRDITFQAGKGMFINSKPTKIKGVCEHHTAGALGAAVPDDVLLNRLLLLKEMGANGIRTSHNPFSNTFYQFCDSIGLMVLNEFTDGWEREKATHDYGLHFEKHVEEDLTRFVKRDNNHPSVIMWSIGNEVKGPTLKTQQLLINTIQKVDSLRMITQGGRDPSRDMEGDEIPTLLGVKGFNGHGEIPGEFEKHNHEFPNEILLGTEVPHTYATRGVYRTKTHWRVRDFPAMWERKRKGDMSYLDGKRSEIPDFTKNEVFKEEITTHYYQNGIYKPLDVDHKWSGQLYYQSSYDNATARIGARQMWQRIDSLPYVIGQFRWTGFDYLGETNNWPSRFANFGIIDICGFPKDPYYLYQSLWSDRPMVHLLPHWMHPGKEGIEIPVVVYTNCDEAELFLNGKSLGKKEYTGEQLVWNVPYQAGELKVVATKAGKTVQKIINTSGQPYGLKLSTNRKSLQANKTDVAEVSIEIIDKNGVPCPMADVPLEFKLSNGLCKLIGTDNGDPLDLSDYKSSHRKTFRGKAKIWLQANDKKGELTLTVNSPKLKEANLKILIE